MYIICNKMGCNNIAKQPERYCEKHKHQVEKEKRERNKFYDRTIRDDKATRFYRSKEWIKTRQMRLIMDSHLCRDCLKEKIITKADTVHHIEELKDNWDKRCDLENLISLCNSCHNKRHKRNISKGEGYIKKFKPKP